MMNSMLDRLARRRAQQRFVSDASHELRSPIASIRTQLEVALAHPEKSAWKDVAEGVLEESLRMERLADDLLAHMGRGGVRRTAGGRRRNRFAGGRTPSHRRDR
jgi:signal transduction histidine kinase